MGRRVLCCGASLLAIVAAGVVLAATPANTPDVAVAAGANVLAQALAELDEYLAVFERSYRPPDHELAALRVAEAALTGARHGSSPRLTLGQELDWDDFSTVTLGLETGVELPLISSSAAAETELAELDLQVSRHAQRLSFAEAKANLLVDLAHLATITWARLLVADAVRLVESAGTRWSMDSDLGYVPPAERDAFDSVQRLFDTQLWLDQQSEALHRRLARTLSLAPEDIQPPSLDDLGRYLDSASGSLADPENHPAAAAVPGCFEASPLVAAARLRHAQSVAHDALLDLPEYTLGLSARLGYAFGPWPRSPSAGGFGSSAAAQGDFNGAIAIEARYAVPEGWPLAGDLTVSVRPRGLEQSLDLAWPPLPRPRPVEVDRDRELATELENIAVDLTNLQRARLLAHDDRLRVERQLSWAVIDLDPAIDEPTLRHLLTLAVTSTAVGILGRAPVDAAPADMLPELELAELRLQLAFARLAEITAQVEYLSACGSL